jgi:hypothetical protein
VQGQQQSSSVASATTPALQIGFFSRLFQGFLQASSLIKDYHSCLFAKGSSADVATAAV